MPGKPGSRRRIARARAGGVGLLLAVLLGSIVLGLRALPASFTIRSAMEAALGFIALGELPYGTGCGLLMPDSDAATSRQCLACHPTLASGGHPYDVDYRAFAGRPGFRSVDEALRRGVFLRNGEMRCVTCHDRNSPWKYHIRLPAGAQPTHAIDRRRPQTYENPSALPPPRPGDDVGKKPLCLGCHARD